MSKIGHAKKIIFDSMWMLLAFIVLMFIPAAMVRILFESIIENTFVVNIVDAALLSLMYLAAAVYIFQDYEVNWMKIDKGWVSVRSVGIIIGASLLWLLWYLYLHPVFTGSLTQLTAGDIALFLIGQGFFIEVLWRGLLFTSLRQRGLRFGLANGIQAGMFASFHFLSGWHPLGIVAMLMVLLLSLLKGWLVEETGSVWPAVVLALITSFIILI